MEHVLKPIAVFIIGTAIICGAAAAIAIPLGLFL